MKTPTEENSTHERHLSFFGLSGQAFPCMLEIEGSSSSGSSDNSVQCLGGTNPLVEGEILTPGVLDDPISVDDDLYKQEDIDEADRWMRENTAQIETIEAGQGYAQTGQAKQREPIREASPTLTLLGTAV